MARRLIEAGVRCVTIDHTNWDTHYNNFHVLKNDLLPQDIGDFVKEDGEVVKKGA